ncbi:MAG TPA: peptide chain release factor N(5)-glutamine methyltransferase [Sphingobacterium sp.]|nr:peptide chain release factor N(5)-glutamine methyltransferase [Sphingobacterium sp.]
MTFAVIERNYQEVLAPLYPVEEIKHLFLIALQKVSSIPASRYLIERDNPAEVDIVVAMDDILKALRLGEPIQHILGETYFYGLTFSVSKDTLIPRSETEELVHLIIQNHREEVGLAVMDIGTGSGCIAVALARNLPLSRVSAVDISSAALSVARLNADRLGQNVNFVLGDILEWDVIFSSQQYFDVIVSNPPYITPKEKMLMHRNVLQYEPHLALFVEEEAPLLFYDYIADFALSHLTMKGRLYFEINQYLGQETADLLRKKGFSEVDIIKDMQGADRIIVAKRG